ncbi:unnamed protein product [Cyprideis torosa]|uniref:Uncharacterized protein n=1 Tax=Cyprideis torosa TaxID=163714 RepID=A0A7R8WI96_9CRUS|nr:unnamed protein product [Cyprideis torosa]CAG0897623.1 unnamed protein product [Cyprideis torosa]
MIILTETFRHYWYLLPEESEQNPEQTSTSPQSSVVESEGLQFSVVESEGLESSVVESERHTKIYSPVLWSWSTVPHQGLQFSVVEPKGLQSSVVESEYHTKGYNSMGTANLAAANIAMFLERAGPQPRAISRIPAAWTETTAIAPDIDGYIEGEIPYEEFPQAVQDYCSQNSSMGLSRAAKVIILGDVAVGKTSLVTRCCRRAFDINYKATIGVDFEVEHFTVLGQPFNLQIQFHLHGPTQPSGGPINVVGSREPRPRVATAPLTVAFLPNPTQWWALDLVGSKEPRPRVATASLTVAWDTAGAERFQCIASSYFRGAQVIVLVFDLAKPKSLSNCMSWLEAALEVNHTKPTLFLVGSKGDLVSKCEWKSIRPRALSLARQLEAEFWPLSAKTGIGIDWFFCRLASLAFLRVVQLEMTQEINKRISKSDPDDGKGGFSSLGAFSE